MLAEIVSSKFLWKIISFLEKIEKQCRFVSRRFKYVHYSFNMNKIISRSPKYVYIHLNAVLKTYTLAVTTNQYKVFTTTE